MEVKQHGYGLAHCYGKDDDVDDDISHESKGHGVSHEWIKERVSSGAAKASPERLGKFSGKMEAKGSSLPFASKAAGKANQASSSANKAGIEKYGKGPTPGSVSRKSGAGKKFEAAKQEGKRSGWAAWKAKNGK